MARKPRKNKRILNIRKLYIKNLKKYTDVQNKEIADLFEIGSSTESNILRERYKENDFIIKSNKKIDKNVKLWSLTPKAKGLPKFPYFFHTIHTRRSNNIC